MTAVCITKIPRLEYVTCKQLTDRAGPKPGHADSRACALLTIAPWLARVGLGLQVTGRHSLPHLAQELEREVWKGGHPVGARHSPDQFVCCPERGKSTLTVWRSSTETLLQEHSWKEGWPPHHVFHVKPTTWSSWPHLPASRMAPFTQAWCVGTVRCWR